MRDAICQDLTWFGINLDAAKNQAAKGEARIDAANSRVQLWIMPTNEELVVARQTKALLEQSAGNLIQGNFVGSDVTGEIALGNDPTGTYDAARRALAAQIQERAFEVVPYVPLGQWWPMTAYRKSLKGVLIAPAEFMWNIEKG